MHFNPILANTLINWYKDNQRDLPWRRTSDPYNIWISEIILQQTRVAQGTGYYIRFIEQFKDVKSLANAPIDEVLRLWQGLGYYSRARNLHFTANTILDKYNSEFPKTYTELLHLKGVGHYTAAAIASFAFNENVAVLDGNVYRVLSRFFGISSDISSTSGQKVFHEISNKNLPTKNSQEYNQAIMEFGALQCTPKSPNCNECPLSNDCHAYKYSLQGELPVKLKKVKTKNRYFNYFIFRIKNQLYLKKRTKNDIWKELYDFHLHESTRSSKPETIIKKDKLLTSLEPNIISVKTKQETVKHILSHQNLFIQFIEVNLNKNINLSENELHPHTILSIKELPKPIVINNYLERHIF